MRVACIRPLRGKYYGTEIDITNDNGTVYTIKLWGGTVPPSERELKDLCSVQDWIDNKPIMSLDWDGKPTKTAAREVFEVCDSHFESQETYELAKFICKAINAAGDRSSTCKRRFGSKRND